MTKKVLVGISGGVDSSVAALLLKNQGYEVVGLHMKNSDNEIQEADDEAAKEVCSKLGIVYYSISYANEIEVVKQYFFREYKEGRTPNPCVLCNREVKFKPFIEFAKKIGADFYATGHYAKVGHKDGLTYLLKAKDQNKDQTYFLNQLSQSQLDKVIFPLGELKKDEVRKIAEENGLVTAHKKDSFDICFVGNQKFKKYMEKEYPQKAGVIVDCETGKTVGHHSGLMPYTFGQRRGLGIGGIRDEKGRWFVVKKDLDKNILYVSTNDKKYLYSNEILIKDVNWIPKMPKEKDFRCVAKCRYREPDQQAEVHILDTNEVLVKFDDPQRAATIGQFVVLYSENQCLGGGVIEEIVR